MSAIDTSFSLTRGAAQKNISPNICKYLDIDSTYRNRRLYPNPNQFVIPLNYPSRNENPATAIDPIVDSIPYTGSSNPVGSNTTQSSVGLPPNQVTLDSQEPAIDNYYINNVLQLTQFPTNYYNITAYNGTSKVATVNGVIGGTVFTGTVNSGAPGFVVPSTTVFALDTSASTVDNIYDGLFLVFTSGANAGQIVTITLGSYIGATRQVTVSPALPFAPINGDSLYITNTIDRYTGTIDTSLVTPTYTTFGLDAGAGAATISNGDWVIFTSGQNAGQIVEIGTYVGVNREVILPIGSALNFVPSAGDAFYIISYVPPTAGLPYYTRLVAPFFQGSVDNTTVPTTTTFTLNSSASSIHNIYQNAYVYFTSGIDMGLSARVLSYNGSTRLITLATALPNAPAVGDTLDLNSYTRDNASTLIYSGNIPANSQNSYYEIELLWMSFPTEILGNGNGGRLDNYPYIYLQLYNEGSQLANQVMYSNNPNSVNALFKIPINLYYGSQSFYTLKDCKQKQIVQFRPDKDLYFALTYSDGTIIEFAELDTTSPNPPNPLLQVNATFGIRKL